MKLVFKIKMDTSNHQKIYIFLKYEKKIIPNIWEKTQKEGEKLRYHTVNILGLSLINSKIWMPEILSLPCLACKTCRYKVKMAKLSPQNYALYLHTYTA